MQLNHTQIFNLCHTIYILLRKMADEKDLINTYFYKKLPSQGYISKL